MRAPRAATNAKVCGGAGASGSPAMPQPLGSTMQKQRRIAPICLPHRGADRTRRLNFNEGPRPTQARRGCAPTARISGLSPATSRNEGWLASRGVVQETLVGRCAEGDAPRKPFPRVSAILRLVGPPSDVGATWKVAILHTPASLMRRRHWCPRRCRVPTTRGASAATAQSAAAAADHCIWPGARAAHSGNIQARLVQSRPQRPARRQTDRVRAELLRQVSRMTCRP